MTVFHYEWKRSRKYILIWGLSLAVCIFSMIPVYYSMIETPELLPKTLQRVDSLKLSASLSHCSWNLWECMDFLMRFLLWQAEFSGCTLPYPCLQKNVPKTQQNTCSQNPAGVFKFIKERCFVYLSAHALRVLHISLRLL